MRAESLLRFLPGCHSRLLLSGWLCLMLPGFMMAQVEPDPLGRPGSVAVYRRAAAATLKPGDVRRLEIQIGPAESKNGRLHQWLDFRGTKVNGRIFMVRVLTAGRLDASVEESRSWVARYLLKQGDGVPREYVHELTRRAVLPSLGGWKYLWPHPVRGQVFRDGFVADAVTWLGHEFELETPRGLAEPFRMDDVKLVELRPDMMVGVPSNSRTVDNVRRFDGSDYPMVRLGRDDYRQMIAAGLNCLRVDAEQAGWLRDEPVFYWGVGGADVDYPECLYQSNYLGPSLFLDEPAVGTRDHDIRPRLAKDPAFRRSISPGVMFEAFVHHFENSITNGPPTVFMKGLRVRSDLDPGVVDFRQANLYSWETMISTAAWQLTAMKEGGPQAIVFEPPGRLGSRRTIPEMNMSYGCELQAGVPSTLSDLIYGFLRGAARVSGKDWGVSIYGAVDPADAPLLLTRAYDLGATHFFFWDNYQLACVPPAEYLALSRHLKAHAARHPKRDLERLKQAGETLLLLPPGYDLGHVQMGRGNLWGIGELNLERRNSHGISHRRVMANLFAEMERCLRLGIPFDVRWDLPGLESRGYREVVRVREDGRVEIHAGGRRNVLRGARVPPRSSGEGPAMHVEVRGNDGTIPAKLEAHATIREKDAPVYYTNGADRSGVHHNVAVLWELYGPGEEDYRLLLEPGVTPRLFRNGNTLKLHVPFSVDRAGEYRLRAATVDERGRSTLRWTSFKVGGK